ncbi:MAG: hypothetical protein ACI8U3_001943 [Brevundimonas sp.]|jgi:hypothetical protein|uniref:hypothetical protein n=1 Tax=Brevundimonas sp. TaxID=1871086 RepID=UPI0039E638F3
MLKLTPLHFDKAELDLVPAEHRLAYFGLGQLANETAILLRTAISAINCLEGTPALHVKDMANATALFATRMLAGRLHEGRLFINSREVAAAFREVTAVAVQKNPMFQKDYADAVQGRARLAQLIDQSQLIEPIRNRAAFHAEARLIAEAYDHLPDQVDFVDHIAPTSGNSIFGAAESLHLTALSALLGQQPNELDYESALAQAITEIGEGVGYLSDFGSGYMIGFVIAYFGVERLQGEGIEVPEAVPIDEMKLPLFSIPPVEPN